VVHALREVTSGQAIAVLEDMLCYLSFNNARFSITVIRMIMVISYSCCDLLLTRSFVYESGVPLAYTSLCV